MKIFGLATCRGKSGFKMELRNFLDESQRGSGSIRIPAGLLDGSHMGLISSEDLGRMGLHRLSDGFRDFLRSSTSEEPSRIQDSFTRNIF